MNESLCSILSGDDWIIDLLAPFSKSLKFNLDGTGELWCCGEHYMWIALDFQWKSIGVGQPVTSATAATRSNKSPQIMGQLNIEITLSRRIPQEVEPRYAGFVFNQLEDTAFQPKSYSIRIEKGHFVRPSAVGSPVNYKHPDKYALRLLFDKSPYPPREEWTEPEGGPDSGRFWNITEFVGRDAPELEKLGRAMNDPAPPGSWESCAVS
ncbi:hypothetical protein LOCC1_G005920 [Lachnellula occidentalis]|uniref:Uncharacterized protein n=1 Tax=Lachnellula occidentalis TaxID=215460 RepID=A0A8H8RY50_9HELO|nr:hypothetical protein LOCC1_G005920 [Lachnellula occidentalis]